MLIEGKNVQTEDVTIISIKQSAKYTGELDYRQT